MADFTVGTGTLAAKHEALRRRLADLGRVLVAYSGGVDSTLLAAVAHEVLGDQAVAITADWLVVPRREVAEARALAQHIGIRHLLVDGNATAALPEFVGNTPERCYHCKSALTVLLAQQAAQLGIAHILHGEVADDAGAWRPGRRAAEEAGWIAPLAEVGLSKPEVRALSAEYGLPTAEKASFSCLATRLPYGSEITAEKLRQIELAEDFLAAEGFRQYRVRHHGTLARIEVLPADLPRLVAPDLAPRLVEHFGALGFEHVTVDLAGFRSGGFDAGLPVG